MSLLVEIGFKFSQKFLQMNISHSKKSSRHHYRSFPKQALVFMCLQHTSFENTVGKGEIVCKEQFLLSHSVFYLFGELFAISIKFEIVVCKLFLLFGKGLKKEKPTKNVNI